MKAKKDGAERPAGAGAVIGQAAEVSGRGAARRLHRDRSMTGELAAVVDGVLGPARSPGLAALEHAWIQTDRRQADRLGEVVDVRLAVRWFGADGRRRGRRLPLSAWELLRRHGWQPKREQWEISRDGRAGKA
jgi:hypothetical protein